MSLAVWLQGSDASGVADGNGIPPVPDVLHLISQPCNSLLMSSLLWAFLLQQV